ncbi:Mobile element protein [Fimbriiglobus ruber]|uniref:Mobile element protein n=1 Tax=Fimbriiglobus ruber TaxID=1908690 RepID=A0A225E9T9_9BACT|nr:Mobile element protein [Fimbriiglobus ruber]
MDKLGKLFSPQMNAEERGPDEGRNSDRARRGSPTPPFGLRKYGRPLAVYTDRHSIFEPHEKGRPLADPDTAARDTDRMSTRAGGYGRPSVGPNGGVGDPRRAPDPVNENG